MLWDHEVVRVDTNGEKMQFAAPSDSQLAQTAESLFYARYLSERALCDRLLSVVAREAGLNVTDEYKSLATLKDPDYTDGRARLLERAVSRLNREGPEFILSSRGRGLLSSGSGCRREDMEAFVLQVARLEDDHNRKTAELTRYKQANEQFAVEFKRLKQANEQLQQQCKAAEKKAEEERQRRHASKMNAKRELDRAVEDMEKLRQQVHPCPVIPFGHLKRQVKGPGGKEGSPLPKLSFDSLPTTTTGERSPDSLRHGAVRDILTHSGGHGEEANVRHEQGQRESHKRRRMDSSSHSHGDIHSHSDDEASHTSDDPNPLG